jgi:hypothetical protein
VKSREWGIGNRKNETAISLMEIVAFFAREFDAGRYAEYSGQN